MSKKLLFTILISCFFPFLVIAQELSSVNGRITLDDETLPGTNIVITNIETGVSIGTVSNIQGFYSIVELYPGSYSIKYTFIGCEDVVVPVVLAINDNRRIDVRMQECESMLDDVEIVAQATSFNQIKTGLSTEISNRTIQALPSVERTLPDYARLSPFYGTENSLSGRDGRGTTLNIDGVSLNNTFGTSSAFAAAGAPVSLDAIREAQVVVAPYDLSQNNFIGGGINAVTKSGSNTFQADAYVYYSGSSLSGRRIEGVKLEKEKQSKLLAGVSLGGKIIENKLFYFVNYEYERRPEPISRWKLSEDGVANTSAMTSRVTQADMNTFADALAEYGYKAGSTDLSDGGSTSHKGLIRLDWNISPKHNLMARFNFSQNTQVCEPSASSTVGSRAASARISKDAYAFSNNCYNINDGAWSGILDLKSHLSPLFSNRFMVSASDVYNKRSSNSSIFPHVDIWDGNGNAFMSAGYELFSWNTGNNVRTYSVNEQAKFSFMRNIVTLGVDAEHQRSQTNYMQAGTGYYKYASLQDFLDKEAPIAFGYTYGYGDGVPQSEFRTSSLGVYVQDQVTFGTFVLNWGFRGDLIYFGGNAVSSDILLDKNTKFRNNLHIDNGTWPERNFLLSPRIGFNWDINDDGHFIARGGAGIFAGRIPTVLFASIPTYSGAIQNYAAVTDPDVLQGLNGKFLTDKSQMKQFLSENGYNTEKPDMSVMPNTVCAVNESFKLPQTVKTSLGFDYNFYTDFPLSMQAEVIYSKDLNAVWVKNYNLRPDYEVRKFHGSDNRLNYRDVLDGVAPYIYSQITNGASVLSNSRKGYGIQAYYTISSEPVANLNIQATYSYQKIMSLMDNQGAQMYSIWTNTPNVNSPNEYVLKRSPYAIPHKVTAYASYKFEYGIRHMSTTIGLFYTAHTSGLYSYMYTNDMNGDGVVNDLIYIPKDKDDIALVDIPQYSAEQQRQALWSFIQNDSYLSRHKGEYAQANAATLNWMHQLDVRLTQDFTINAKKDKHILELTLDILNLPNLLCSAWGVQYGAGPCNYGRILKYEGIDADKVPQYSVYYNSDGLLSKRSEVVKNSAYCWQLQLGLRYKF